MRSSRLWLAVLGCACASLVPVAWPAQAAATLRRAPDTHVWVANGPVNAIAVAADGTAYIGGDFTRVGKRTGGGVPVSAATGARRPPYPFVEGVVTTAVSDLGGGYYIGGRFWKVGGVTRKYLAHILADGSLDPTFNPSPNDVVRAIAVSGNRVYVGGDFSAIGGKKRAALACVNRRGAVTAWNPHPGDAAEGGPPIIGALAVDLSRVYVGGDFGRIGGEYCTGLAAVDPVTGKATGWSAVAWDASDPDFTSPGFVWKIALSGPNVYVAGRFTSIGGADRPGLAALDATTADATSWDPQPSGRVNDLAVSGPIVYAGGMFTSIGGQTRNGIAALDASGNATSWDPNAGGVRWPSVDTIAVPGSPSTNVYVGGDFRSIGGEGRRCVAALDAVTGAATSWDPVAGGEVLALVASDDTVYIGGAFSLVGGTPRNHLAALSRLGVATGWNPDADGIVKALAVSGTTVYAGGDFTSVGGVTRNHIASLTPSGGVSSWDPNADAAVTALAVSGQTVYAGGGFTTIGGLSRGHLAALDDAGAATAWQPALPDPANPDDPVIALAVTASRVYAAATRSGLHGFDRTTGATASTPATDGPVHALARVGSRIYAGGDFSRFGGRRRSALAAFDATTGKVARWHHSAGGDVYSISASKKIVYYGGQSWARLGGPRAANAVTGRYLPWFPACALLERDDGTVYALARSGSRLYVGGDFSAIGGKNNANLARFSPR